MNNFIIFVMSKYGYYGIFLLILLENLFPPIPSELILTFSGFLAIDANLSLIIVIVSATLGSLLGAIILYYGGYYIVDMFKFKKDNITLSNKWFNNKGNKAVFLCRFIPIVRSLISIPAGIYKMPLLKFIVYTFLGSLIWNSVLIFIGAFAGDRKELFIDYIDIFSYVIVIVTILIIFINKKRNN